MAQGRDLVPPLMHVPRKDLAGLVLFEQFWMQGLSVQNLLLLYLSSLSCKRKIRNSLEVTALTCFPYPTGENHSLRARERDQPTNKAFSR